MESEELKKGDKGEKVRELQKELNEHFDAKLVVDGDFGPNTDTSVRAVQAYFGTESDGIVDSDLWKALGTLKGLVQDITPRELSIDKEVIPFAIQMPHIPTRWTYTKNWPVGAILHFTAGKDNPRGTVTYLGEQGYPCLVMARNGVLYQPFPVSRGGYHSGTAHHRTCVGLEVISAGRCIPVILNGKQKYAPWYAFKNGNPATGIVQFPNECFEESEMRYVKRDGSCREGWYQMYTREQEEAIIKTFLWYKWADPNKSFSFDLVLGHDEACDQGGRPGAKNDPGGALSMTMPKFRKLLNERYLDLISKPMSYQLGYFGYK